MEWRRDEFVISTDPERIDLPLLHGHLAQAYWSENVPLDVVQRSIENSLVFGVYRAPGGDVERWEQVGFARVVTDRATFGWLCDVIVFPEHRGRGLGKWLVECIVAHPELTGLRRLMLGTRDAQGLYAQFGFEIVDAGRFMHRRRPVIA